jgi:hypothetical protein
MGRPGKKKKGETILFPVADKSTEGNICAMFQAALKIIDIKVFIWLAHLFVKIAQSEIYKLIIYEKN